MSIIKINGLNLVLFRYNKQLWAVTGGTFLGTSVETARKQLLKAKPQILAGVSYYRPFNEESEKKLKCLDVKTLSFVVNIAQQMVRLSADSVILLRNIYCDALYLSFL